MNKKILLEIAVEVVFIAIGWFLLQCGFKNPQNLLFIFLGSWIFVLSMLKLAVSICDLAE